MALYTHESGPAVKRFRAVSRFLTSEMFLGRLSPRGDSYSNPDPDKENDGASGSAWHEEETNFRPDAGLPRAYDLGETAGPNLESPERNLSNHVIRKSGGEKNTNTAPQGKKGRNKNSLTVGVAHGNRVDNGSASVNTVRTLDQNNVPANDTKRTISVNSDISTQLSVLAESIQSLDNTLKSHQQFTKGRMRSATPASPVPAAEVPYGLLVNDVEDQVKKATVYISVVFLKIGDIDTVKETFVADVFIQASWREPKLDGKMHLDEDKINWDRLWNPKIFIDNLLGEAKETIWHATQFDERRQAMVYEKRRLKGTFLETMELNAFPFDTQDLTVMLASELPEAEIELEEDENEICRINVQSFVDEQEWSLHSHVETRKVMVAPEHKNSQERHPAICACCKARRRSGFFIWNILVVMLFICSLSFATFTVHDDKPQNRLQLSFTLVLTTIAFKFTANQSLPKISYLTYLDKYILTSMGILCCISVWHSIIPSIAKKHGLDTAKKADYCALSILGVSYVIFQIFYFSYVRYKSVKDQRNYERKDKEHKAKLERLKYHPDRDQRILMRKIVPMF